MPNVPAWKRAEQRLAKLFGSRRRPLSGGNQGTGRDDSMHPVLFLECKHSKKHTLWTLWRQVKERARKENRVPVVGLQEANCPGCLLVVHTDDLPTVVFEWLRANKEAWQSISEEFDIFHEGLSSLQKDRDGKPKNHPSPVVGSGVGERIIKRMKDFTEELEGSNASPANRRRKPRAKLRRP